MKVIRISFLLVICVLCYQIKVSAQTSFNFYFSINFTRSQITYDKSNGILTPFFSDNKVSVIESKNILSNFNLGINIEHRLSEYLYFQLRTGYLYQNNQNDRHYLESDYNPTIIRNPNDTTQNITINMKKSLNILPIIKMTGWYLSPLLKFYPLGSNNTPLSLNIGANLSYVHLTGHYNYSFKEFYLDKNKEIILNHNEGVISEFRGEMDNLIISIPITLSYDITISDFVLTPELGIQLALDIPKFPVYQDKIYYKPFLNYLIFGLFIRYSNY